MSVTAFNGVEEEERTYRNGDEKTGRLSRVIFSRKGFVSRSATSPLSGNYRIQDNWLHDIVVAGTFQGSAGEADQQFGKTYVLNGVGADKARYRFVLASQYGCVCIRSFRSTSAQTPDGRIVTSETISKVTGLQKYEGIWLPTGVETRLSYDNEHTAKMTAAIYTTLEVAVKHINDVPPGEFTLPPLQEGCKIIDRDTMTQYRWKNGKRVRESGPLTSRDNFWRWGFTASVATGILGAVRFGVNRVQPKP